MRILKLEAESYLRLNVVSITPDGHIVELSGRNGSGKTSCLSAIWAALGGGKHVPGQPIHTGKDKAYIRVTLGDKEVELVVERRFTEHDSRLIVETADGARKTNQQAVLNAFLGALGFDPMDFARAKPPEQYTMLRGIVKLDVDPEHLAGLNQSDFEKRTDINRDAARFRAQADGIVLPPDCPTERRDTQEIIGRLASAGSHNADIATRRGNREQATEKIATLRAEATQIDEARPRQQAALEKDLRETTAEIEGQIRALEDKIQRARGVCQRAVVEMSEASEKDAATRRAAADDLQRRLDEAAPLPEPIDAAAVRAELTSAEDTNILVDRRNAREQHLAAAAEKETEAAKLTERIEARKSELAAALARAEMPIAGVGLDYEKKVVLYNGVPFDQASSADQIKVGVSIAMALNPKLRVMLVREGSFLDDDNLALLAKMAEDHDYQVWIEQIRPTSDSSIVIEDGYTRGLAPARAPVVAPEQGKLV